MKPLRILLAEDDPLVAIGLERGLAELGYPLTATTGSAREIVTLLVKHRPHLLIAEQNLLQKTGLDVQQMVVISEMQLSLPIVLLADHPPGLSHKDGFRRSDLIYLVKPVDPEELAGAITWLGGRDSRFAGFG